VAFTNPRPVDWFNGVSLCHTFASWFNFKTTTVRFIYLREELASVYADVLDSTGAAYELTSAKTAALAFQKMPLSKRTSFTVILIGVENALANASTFSSNLEKNFQGALAQRLFSRTLGVWVCKAKCGRCAKPDSGRLSKRATQESFKQSRSQLKDTFTGTLHSQLCYSGHRICRGFYVLYSMDIAQGKEVTKTWLCATILNKISSCTSL